VHGLFQDIAILVIVYAVQEQAHFPVAQVLLVGIGKLIEMPASAYAQVAGLVARKAVGEIGEANFLPGEHLPVLVLRRHYHAGIAVVGAVYELVRSYKSRGHGAGVASYPGYIFGIVEIAAIQEALTAVIGESSMLLVAGMVYIRFGDGFQAHAVVAAFPEIIIVGRQGQQRRSIGAVRPVGEADLASITVLYLSQQSCHGIGRVFAPVHAIGNRSAGNRMQGDAEIGIGSVSAIRYGHMGIVITEIILRAAEAERESYRVIGKV